MKRIIYLTVIALMLMACSDSQYTNKYRYNDFIVQYKINKESSIGSIATVYGDRIYYFSDEQETPGIYSMDFNGNDVRCELEARDIQKIQIKDDILYYLTMEKVIYGSKGSQWGNRYYSLKSLDLKMGNTQSYDIIEEAVIKKKYSSDYRVSDGTLWEVQTALCFR